MSRTVHFFKSDSRQSNKEPASTIIYPWQQASTSRQGCSYTLEQGGTSGVYIYINAIQEDDQKGQEAIMQEDMEMLQPASTSNVVEVPVETLVTDNNEIQTINIGNCSDVLCLDSETRVKDIVAKSSINSSDSDPKLYKPKIQGQPKYMSKVSLPDIGNRKSLVRRGRSRMIADAITCIPVQEFKVQLSDTSDIIGAMEVAPPTKRTMHILKTKGVNKLFANPGRPVSSSLYKFYSRHLTLRQIPTEKICTDLGLQPLVTSKKGERDAVVE